MNRLVSSATVNREVELLRRIVNKAASPEWSYATAKVDWQRHLLEESEGNTRSRLQNPPRTSHLLWSARLLGVGNSDEGVNVRRRRRRRPK